MIGGTDLSYALHPEAFSDLAKSATILPNKIPTSPTTPLQTFSTLFAGWFLFQIKATVAPT